MVFASKGYNRVQPQSQDDLNRLINEDYKFCKSGIKDVMEFKGKCDVIDLPSWHPYWANEVKRGIHKRLYNIKEQLAECQLKPFLYKYYFGKSDIEIIEMNIANLEKECEGVIL